MSRTTTPGLHARNGDAAPSRRTVPGRRARNGDAAPSRTTRPHPDGGDRQSTGTAVAVAAALVGAAALLGAAGCGSPAPEPNRGAGGARGDAAVYAAVIAAAVAETPAAGVVYVLDHTVENAADPDAGASGETIAIPAATRAHISAALSDVDLDWIDDPDSVVNESRKTRPVRGGGVVITLGPTTGRGDRLEVGAAAYRGLLGGMWTTYVVERIGDGWEVTGTTGAASMS